MSISETLSPLLGRLLLGWFFLTQVGHYAGAWEPTLNQMARTGVPGGAFVLAVALLIMVMGAISLILGYHARYGALGLFVITAFSDVMLHAYWRFADAYVRATEFQIFAAQAAIAGGLLLVVGNGPGPIAIDNGGKRR